ncbi:MAG: type I restriction endonuclease subunit R [Candidatus Spyradenecus sp.]
MTTNIREEGLEALIVAHLRDVNGYVEGKSELYSKEEALVKAWLEGFLRATQPEKLARTFCFANELARAKFYQSLSKELAKRGVTDLLRNGFAFNGTTFDLYYPLPDAQNPSAKRAYAQNCFGVIRQLHYSKRKPNDALDFVLFLNGLPIATFELKNRYTNQNVQLAIAQYQRDRQPEGEPLLKPKRCAVHFAVDDCEVWMCSELAGDASRFVPFNRGVNGGAGNPVIPGKTMTSYLWEEILTKRSLSNILENFAQVVDRESGSANKPNARVIWPRYHQLDAVRQLLAQTAADPVGRKFLIQHSAGSGKSNTITWLAYQLVLLQRADGGAFFDSIIVVTDRVNLDKQIRDNINAFARLKNLVGWADTSDRLRQLLQGGKKIIVSTIHKFAFILDEIGTSLKNKRFAIIIDEAHSSQNGEMASSLAASVSGSLGEEPEDIEDKICSLIKARHLARNANYYAFTATPKNKTLEMFGERCEARDGVTYVPFHEYTMKQAIEEEFILDVLRNYTPYRAYYEVVKKIEDDPEFDKGRAQKRIHAYVEQQPETIQAKSRIIVEHFCTKVAGKIGGRARAMVVTSSIERAIAYYREITRLLQARGGQFKAIVAFTEKEVNGQVITEASLNGFPSALIEEKIVTEPYRLLIVADKFQTGYDQPLLHTMYVDKPLSDLKAVQTLSRLNRTHKQKADTFVLDFVNEPESIRQAFQRYYKTTLLSGESDVNKLNGLIETIERTPCYTAENRDRVVELFLSGRDEDRVRIDALLDGCVMRFKDELEDDAQIRTKSAMKNYCRIYPFFAAIMPYESLDWERYYLFYSLLVRKLPLLPGDNPTQGLIEAIDFKKYRLQKLETLNLSLEDTNAAVDPIPVSTGGGRPEASLEPLSAIVEAFNKAFGDIDWGDSDEVRRKIDDISRLLVQQEDFVNTLRASNEEAKHILFNERIQGAITKMDQEPYELMRQYFTNEVFKNALKQYVFQECQARVTAASRSPAQPSGWSALEDSGSVGLALAAEDSALGKNA